MTAKKTPAPKLKNAPKVKLALVGVSRDCFPVSQTKTRLKTLARAYRDIGGKPYTCKTIIETEADAMTALAEVLDAGCNAAVIYLGNFGPEGPLAIFAEEFPGPVMACAAAEESRASLASNRGDAFCGMLNASYNFNLRSLNVHIPEAPVGLPAQLADQIAHFQTVARVVLGVWDLKIFSFGPRPQDFFACNAPIKPLYDLGVEVMENSELDLLTLFNAVDEKEPAVKRVAKAMAAELGAGNTYPDLLPKLARYEVALKRFAAENLGSRQFGIFANKCWPAFESHFGFVPCYVNSRMSAQGVPISCEVDIYGAFSEYIGYIASGAPTTLLDLNNTVPPDMVPKTAKARNNAAPEDLFMGFHCGNTPTACMKNCALNYQVIMHRLMEDPDLPPNITRGTLEGQIAASPTTVFRVQGSADSDLSAYISQGQILDIDPCTFGGIGVFAIPGFARFYRHVLIEGSYPHHAAIAFAHSGRVLFDAIKMLGVEDISTPLPTSVPYPLENRF
ncbi:MAG: fucose isomerase [Phycisphaerales bacterium]|jgi:L-fucose isomerase-like protein|nr:fucose isomerase [Phycisphaerales bacterium]